MEILIVTYLDARKWVDFLIAHEKAVNGDALFITLDTINYKPATRVLVMMK